MIEFEIINEKKYNQRGIYLWRYFDLHKFFNFLRNKEIRFTRMDGFEDPMEGVPLRALITYAEEKDLEIIGDDMLSDLILDKTKFEKLSIVMQRRINNINAIQCRSFVSCWFLGQRESMAMWNLYSNSDGVAIRVSAIKLFQHFEKFAPQLYNQDISSFYGGKVVYQDFKSIDTEDETSAVPRVALRKDLSYKHEEEFRFVIRTTKDSEEQDAFTSVIDNFRALNLKVVCHPLMAEWKRDNIQQILKDAGQGKAFSLSEIRLRKK